MKIVLACAGGLSTGMLVKKMEEAAQNDGLDVTILACGLSELEENIANASIILLGPQVGYQDTEVKKKYPEIPVTVIEMLDYGMMNGEKVLKSALSLVANY